MAARARYRSWGRPLAGAAQQACRPRWRSDPLLAVKGSLLPFGNGRSYGDSCLNTEGTLIDARGLDRFIAFDGERGVLRCEAGVLLSEILKFFVPRGWFLPVTPGTRFVTLGGAIANDVHGKNHHLAGSFGHHVRCLELLRSDGTRLCCSPEENPDWFAATIGGLGLTGLIVWAEVTLKPIGGPAMQAETVRFSDLDEFFELSRSSHDGYEYIVAWIDCLRRPEHGVRGLFFRGNHAGGDTGPVRAPRQKPGIPLTPPVSLLSRPAIALFNAVTYYRPHRRHQRMHYEQFFYPLDSLPYWNRLFGRKGFYQYQCVIPIQGGEDVLRELLGRVAAAGEGSFLGVLKVFGDREPRGWLSFARPGVTLAIDLPDRGSRTLETLRDLDEITMAAAGAVYPAKDARMSAATFQRSFPRWKELEARRDLAFMSSFWRRVTAERPWRTC